MPEDDALYEFLIDPVTVPRGLDLVIALNGYGDAGGVSGQFIDYARDAVVSEPILRFSNDELLDYRSRRPVMTFEEDHLSEYQPPRLELALASDEMARPFLLLTGYEPDMRWEGFVRALVAVTDRLGVARTTWMHSVPMPVPHTRPIGVTVSGTRADLAETLSIWRPRTQLPGNVLHLLEFRLAEHGSSVTGLAILTPHYLGDTQYPEVLIAALGYLGTATGLLLPTDELRESGREFTRKIDDQIENNDELERLVTTLEERYDSYVEAHPGPANFPVAEGDLPSAEELAEELQRFLAAQREPDAPGGGAGPVGPTGPATPGDPGDNGGMPPA